MQLPKFPCNNGSMADDKVESELKSEIAQHKPRDEEGHFIHAERSEVPSAAEGSNPISKFFSEHTHYSKSQDDLLDIHVGNPLRRITKLLEDIKKQKAFSFTLKGSLGIMGVFLALSVFGIFGGGKILCDKGVRTEIGTVKMLQVMDESFPSIPIFSQILSAVEWTPKQMHNKTVLIKNDETVIRLPYSRNVDFAKYTGYPVIATGNYDSCSQTLSVTNPGAMEMYVKVGR